MPLITRGTQKPPLGAIPDLSHPMALGHRRTVLFHEGRGRPQIYAAQGVASSYNYDMSSFVLGSWTSNSRGLAFSATDVLQVATNGSFFPTGQATVGVIRRKVDTTLRNAALFGTVGGAPFTQRCGAHAPYGDGNLYWDFGGGRVTLSGLTWTTLVESWLFTGGPSGLAVWRNGVKIGTDATARDRPASVDPDYINGGQGVAVVDPTEFTVFMVNNYQWDDDMCRWWSAEPYAYFARERPRRQFFEITPGAGGAVGGTSGASQSILRGVLSGVGRGAR